MRQSVNDTLVTMNLVLLSVSPSISLVRLHLALSPSLAPESNETLHPSTAVKNGTMTLRERDTTLQLLGSIEEVITLVHDLCRGSCTWDDAQKRLPAYTGEQDA